MLMFSFLLADVVLLDKTEGCYLRLPSTETNNLNMIFLKCSINIIRFIISVFHIFLYYYVLRLINPGKHNFKIC